MTPGGKNRDSTLDRFSKVYGRSRAKAELLLEKEVIGANVGCRGYTTPEQADGLAKRLGLHPGSRLLDIGAGRGWPGLYLAQKTGCEVVLTDPAAAGPRAALGRASRQRLRNSSSMIVADATSLPFRPGVFDAIVHTDVL